MPSTNHILTGIPATSSRNHDSSLRLHREILFNSCWIIQFLTQYRASFFFGVAMFVQFLFGVWVFLTTLWVLKFSTVFVSQKVWSNIGSKTESLVPKVWFPTVSSWFPLEANSGNSTASSPRAPAAGTPSAPPCWRRCRGPKIPRRSSCAVRPKRKVVSTENWAFSNQNWWDQHIFASLLTHFIHTAIQCHTYHGYDVLF